MIKIGYHTLVSITPQIVKRTLKIRDTKKIFDWKIQLEKGQITRDLKDDTILHKAIRLPCENFQGYCDPTTRTQLTNVWFPEDSCTKFQAARIHARLTNYHHKYFI